MAIVLDEKKYLVIKREKAEKMLSKEIIKKLDDAMNKIGYKYFVVNLDETASRKAMETYFKEREKEEQGMC